MKLSKYCSRGANGLSLFQPNAEHGWVEELKNEVSLSHTSITAAYVLLSGSIFV